jgi:hypothetical protein
MQIAMERRTLNHIVGARAVVLAAAHLLMNQVTNQLQNFVAS